MLEVESMMRLTIHDTVSRAVDDYVKRDRNEWVLAWPGQAVLCVSQLYWTIDFERNVKEQFRYSSRTETSQKDTNMNANAVVPHKGGPLVRYKEQLEGYVTNTVNLVRGTLTKLQRKTLSALIIMDVHAKDVVEKLVKIGKW